MLGFANVERACKFVVEVVEHYNKPIHLHSLLGQNHKVHQIFCHIGESIALQLN